MRHYRLRASQRGGTVFHCPWCLLIPPRPIEAYLWREQDDQFPYSNRISERCHRHYNASSNVDYVLQVVSASEGRSIVLLLRLLFKLIDHRDTSWSDFPTIFISKVYSITLVASLSSPRHSVRPRAPSPSTAQTIALTSPDDPHRWRHPVVSALRSGRTTEDSQSGRMMLHHDESSEGPRASLRSPESHGHSDRARVRKSEDTGDDQDEEGSKFEGVLEMV